MERRPQSSRLTWLAVALGAGACAILGHVGADARWLAALGRAILAQGSIPSGVPYAASPSVDWVNVPVLGELVFHALQAVGGDRGLLFAQLLGASAALALLASGMRALGASDAASALVVLLVFVGGFPSFIIVRAQLFSLVLFCLALLLIRAEAHRPSRRVWLLVPLIGLWANLHGGVLVGLAVAAGYLVLERARREPVVAAGVLAACRAALFLTPAFASSGSYYLGVLQSEAAKRGEGMWAPLSYNAPFDVLFVLVAIPLLVFAYPLRPESVGVRLRRGIRRADVAGRAERDLAPCFIAAPAAHGLGKRFLRDFTVSPRPLVLCAMLPVGVPRHRGDPDAETGAARAHECAVRLRDWPPVSRSSPTAWTRNNSRSTAGRSGLRIRSTRSPAVTSAAIWIGSMPAPAGDACCAKPPPSLVTRGSAPQHRLERDRSFRRAAVDANAVVYVRVPSNG